jgi:hypothetical protein
LKVAGEDLPQVAPIVDGVSRQMVQPGSSRFSQTDRGELDDEQIIILSSRSTLEAVILQPDTGVGFAIVFGDIARRLKASSETSVVHGASEHLWTGPFRVKAKSL